MLAPRHFYATLAEAQRAPDPQPCAYCPRAAEHNAYALPTLNGFFGGGFVLVCPGCATNPSLALSMGEEVTA
jgi:hypothetical protein